MTRRDPAKAHGINGYTNLGCRCEVCRAAWADYIQQRRYQRERELSARTDIPHGRVSTYGNWRCRCQPCTTAWSKDTVKRRKRVAGRTS